MDSKFEHTFTARTSDEMAEEVARNIRELDGIDSEGVNVGEIDADVGETEKWAQTHFKSIFSCKNQINWGQFSTIYGLVTFVNFCELVRMVHYFIFPVTFLPVLFILSVFDFWIPPRKENPGNS